MPFKPEQRGRTSSKRVLKNHKISHKVSKHEGGQSSPSSNSALNSGDDNGFLKDERLSPSSALKVIRESKSVTRPKVTKYGSNQSSPSVTKFNIAVHSDDDNPVLECEHWSPSTPFFTLSPMGKIPLQKTMNYQLSKLLNPLHQTIEDMRGKIENFEYRITQLEEHLEEL